MSLFAELRRRNVIRMAGLYLVGAWLLVQVASIALPAFGVPDWVLRAVIILLVLGFVPALVFAWIFELTPEGLKRDHEVAPAQSIASETGRRMDRLLAVGLVAVVAVVAADRFWPREEEKGTEGIKVAPTDIPNPGTAGATLIPSVPFSSSPARKSIAVLPFVNLSADPEQEFFSDGMAEEIINALTRIRDLKVAGRTSSFHFKGKNEDLRAIGEALGVAHILEGSVRKQGDKVRITAQLIQASDGFHLWSDTYDGDLADVFELQERIARAITGKLEVVLQGEQQTRLVRGGTNDTEAYALYLQATAVMNRRDRPRMGEAIGWLGKAIELDPGFARGHSLLAMIHALGDKRYGSSLAEAERHARRALDPDPALAEPHVVLALVATVRHAFVDSRAAIERALAIEPDDPGVNFYYAQSLIVTGYTAAGIARLERTLAMDPMLPNAHWWRANQYQHAGDLHAAQRAYERADALGLTFAWRGLRDLARLRGDRESFLGDVAKDVANPDWSCLKDPVASMALLYDGQHSADATVRATALQVVDGCLATTDPGPVPLWTIANLFRLGQPTRALALARESMPENVAGFYLGLWGRDGREARRTPEFAGFARDMGLADLWEQYGPPEGCRRVAPRDYTCD